MIVLLFLVGAILEIIINPILLFKGDIWPFLACHLFAVMVIYTAFILFDKRTFSRHRLRPILFYSCMISMFFPCIGSVASFLLILFKKLTPIEKKLGIYSDYEEYIGEGLEDIVYEHSVYEKILREARKEVSFEPFIDVVKSDDNRTKERVIKKLSKIEEYDSVHLLKEALRDESSEIRFYASGALIKIEESMNKKARFSADAFHPASRQADRYRCPHSYPPLRPSQKGISATDV